MSIPPLPNTRQLHTSLCEKDVVEWMETVGYKYDDYFGTHDDFEYSLETHDYVAFWVALGIGCLIDNNIDVYDYCYHFVWILTQIKDVIFPMQSATSGVYAFMII